MATLFPDISTIKKLHQKPTEGELTILEFLASNLDLEFEIYFNPYINGDRPDIIVIRKNYGVFIIEVKDWDLNRYYIDPETDWRTIKNNQRIKSPIDQVESYKKNLINLHIEGLLPKTILNKNYYSLNSSSKCNF